VKRRRWNGTREGHLRTKGITGAIGDEVVGGVCLRFEHMGNAFFLIKQVMVSDRLQQWCKGEESSHGSGT